MIHDTMLPVQYYRQEEPMMKYITSRIKKKINHKPPHYLLDVYVIYSAERYNNIQKIIYDHYLMEAIFPKDLKDDALMNMYTTPDFKKKKENVASKFTVHLSYVCVLYHAITSEKPLILIFEDDNDNYDLDNDTLMHFYESPYDVCYLGYCNHCQQLAASENFHNLYLLEKEKDFLILCKHAIVYKKQILPTLLSYLLPQDDRSDRFLCQILKKLDLKVCIPDYPFYFQQRQKFSSNNHNQEKTLPFCDVIKKITRYI